MMSYKFAGQLLLRVPVKSWSGYRYTDIAVILKDPFFLSAIYIASQAFYTRLVRVNFNYDELNTRERNTLRKYHNRICFRPTPFGLFASIALVSWGHETCFNTVSGNHRFLPYIAADQACVMALSDHMLANDMHCAGLYAPNPFLYKVDKEYRFLHTMLDDAYKTRSYDLQSTDHSPLLRRLLLFCQRGKSKEEIISYIIDSADCTVEDAEGYFQFMAGTQLLLSNLRPNITGESYLDRLKQKMPITDQRSVSLNAIENVLANASDSRCFCPDLFIDLNKKLKDALPERVSPPEDEQLSIVLKDTEMAGCLSSDHQQTISDAIFALDQLVPQRSPKGLRQFIKTFKKQFDQQSVPLLKILDPEIGIGYQAPDTAVNNPLLETLSVNAKLAETSMKWTNAHRYLLDCWHMQPGSDPKVIRLKKEGLLKVKKEEPDMQIQGMSVLFRVVDDRVLIESIGGVNAPALLGRFTVTDLQIAAAARQMAAETEAANPDIIFAELLHLTDPHTDNINKRERIWTKELPLTACSLADQDDQVALADLFVSVENDKVILRSARHKKVVIPRLTSAYNYAINKLPLFHFLGDVAYQFGKTNFTLDMGDFFPGLAFYPRVEYGAAILCSATWVLCDDDINHLMHNDDQAVITAFDHIADKLNFPDVFLLTQGDQQLVFYRDRPDDILLFAECVKNKGEATIKEYLQDGPGNSILKNENGDSFVNQFNAFIYSDKPMTFAAKANIFKPASIVQRHFVLGSEWLYLKIYIPKLGANKLLLKIRPLLKRTFTHGPVSKWFFVRYDDHSPHIRIRLKIAPQDLGEVLLAFKQTLEKSIYQHIIREYQADTYSREIERYQAGNYDSTEDLFWHSSELVLQMLKAEQMYPDEVAPYLFALYSVKDMLNVFLPDQAEQLAFAQQNYQGFSCEFEDKKISFELDKKYRDLSKNINLSMRDGAYYDKIGARLPAQKFIASARQLALKVQTQQGAGKVFLASIIHMHLNRIFIDDPRKQEMMIYYFLSKFIQSDIARKKVMVT